MNAIPKRNRGGYFAALDASSRARASQGLGEAGEAVCRAIMARHGIKKIERIHTGWKVLWGVENGRRVPKEAFPIEKVSGDFIGMMRGLKVLVECKATDGDRLEFSRLEKHQVMALNETVELEGISMLFVLIAGHASLLRWPITGFKPGTSLVQDGEALYVR